MNFENGFNAAAGNIFVVGGSTSTPTAGPETFTMYDSGSQSNVVRVGSSSAKDAALGYTGLDAALMAQSGKITLNFKINTTSIYPNSPVVLFMSDESASNQNYWFIGLNNRRTVLVRSHSNIGGPNSGIKEWTADCGANLAYGWHTMTFVWQRTAAFDSGLNTRERANIVLQVDGIKMVEAADVFWTNPGNTRIYVGSFWAGVSSLRAGEDSVLLDNISIVSRPAECGQPGTSYMSADLNADCYVNFKDIAVFAAKYLFCTDPHSLECDSYWNRNPDTMLMKNEQVVTTANPIVLTFVPPVYQERAFLSLEGRLQWPQNLRGGSNPCVRYVVNGVVVDNPKLMVNVPDARDLITGQGSSISWIGTAGNWRLPNSPDWNEFSNSNNPREPGTNPYLTVLDISNYLLQGKPNTIQIMHYMSSSPDNVMPFRNVQILGNYTRPQADPNLRDIPQTPQQPVVPKTDLAVNYTADLSSGGGVNVTIRNEQYVIDSKFSFPNGTYNWLKASGSASGEWNVVKSGDTITATGSKYRIVRSVMRLPDHVAVEDAITNTSGSLLGIRIGHQASEAKASLTKSYLCGVRSLANEGSASVSSTTSGNPTVYVTKILSGIGLFPRDSVMRTHVRLSLADGAYGFFDDYFALDVGETYKTKWEIYPTSNPDYYAFINALRRTLNVNYLIDGVMVIAHGHVGNMANIADQDIIDLVEKNNAKYVVLGTNSHFDSTGNPARGTCSDLFLFGPAFMTDAGYWGRYWLNNVIQRYRALRPDVRILPYIDTWIDSEPNATAKYPDSYARQPSGNPQLYMDCMSILYPYLADVNSGTDQMNSYGRDLHEFFQYLSSAADGFYLDESSMAKSIDSGVFSYRDDTWDGHSCIMDNSTFGVIRKVTNSALYSLAFRVSERRKALDSGKHVWNNFAPATEEETNLHSYHFIETRLNNNCVYGHLSTPIGFGNDNWERFETDLGASVRFKLLNGGLFLPYNVKYKTGGNILQDIYPITPLELHAGYIIGRGKIITCLSGEYGFGNSSNLTVKIYDSAGFYLPARVADFRYDTELQSTVAHVELNNGEMAIIFQ